MKVAIDPGHGMSNRQKNVYDPGAIHIENGFRFEEATLALRYALALKDEFRARGVAVFMTRDDAEDHTPVGNRAPMARKAGCELFISMHLNDFDDDAANGLEVLYGNDGSKALARALCTVLARTTGMKDRGVKARPELAVLRFKGPAVLVELGFIANDADRRKVLDASVRHAVCNAIADVVLGDA